METNGNILFCGVATRMADKIRAFLNPLFLGPLLWTAAIGSSGGPSEMMAAAAVAVTFRRLRNWREMNPALTWREDQERTCDLFKPPVSSAGQRWFGWWKSMWAGPQRALI